MVRDLILGRHKVSAVVHGGRKQGIGDRGIWRGEGERDDGDGDGDGDSKSKEGYKEHSAIYKLYARTATCIFHPSKIGSAF